MTTKEQARPLLIALKAEREAVGFYARMVNRSNNPTGQEIFKRLVKEEKGHVNVIERRLKLIKVPADTSDITEKASLLTDLDFSDPSLSDMEVIDKALEDEKHAYDFYTKAEQEAETPEDAAIYTLLATDEKKHICVLEGEQARLKNV